MQNDSIDLLITRRYRSSEISQKLDKAKNEHSDVRNVSFKKIYEFKNSVRPVFAQEFST